MFLNEQMSEYKQTALDKFLEFFIKNKIRAVVSFIVWSLIYKIIDMNSLQLFGRDIFVDGSVLGFFVTSGFSLCVFLFLFLSIYQLFTGQKF